MKKLNYQKITFEMRKIVDIMVLSRGKMTKQKLNTIATYLTLALFFFLFTSPVEANTGSLKSGLISSHSTTPTPHPTTTPFFCGAYCHEFAIETVVPSDSAILETPISMAGVTLQDSPKVVIYMFWGDGCPHCATAKPILEEMDQNSDQIELKMFEVWYVEENQVLFTKMAKAYGFEPQAVPTFFIGDQHWEGFSDQIQAEITSAVQECLVDGCEDYGTAIINGADPSSVGPLIPKAEPTVQPIQGKSITLPLIGSIDLSAQSLFVSTLLISIVDGFNPCSLWVLTMLLALTLHSGSRKKIFLIGLIFLTVSTAIYGLFITGLFTMFTVVSFVGWIQVVVALVALFFALVNIKDYFWYKEGISFTISDDKKPGIFQRMRRLMDAGTSFWGLVSGTVVLAAGVSLVEFSCTAGFPVLWTNLLVSQQVTGMTFVLLLLVYLFIYQMDEMVIFVVAVTTMRASKLEEKHGRILKLIGGMLMLALAGVMLINPSLMNNLTSSLIVFGIAFGATLVILFIHRIILPRAGIHIGTEFARNTKPKNNKSK